MFSQRVDLNDASRHHRAARKLTGNDMRVKPSMCIPSTRKHTPTPEEGELSSSLLVVGCTATLRPDVRPCPVGPEGPAGLKQMYQRIIRHSIEPKLWNVSKRTGWVEAVW